jgi:hypothetical protein
VRHKSHADSPLMPRPDPPLSARRAVPARPLLAQMPQHLLGTPASKIVIFAHTH